MSYREFTVEQLLRLVTYDPETGQFHRLGQFYKGGTFKTFESPRPVTGTNSGGYVQLRIGREHVFGHRLAWFLTHGEWPNVVDHINGDRSDNRIANLRNLTQAENCQNIRAPKSHNTTGFLGVSFERERGKYVAALSHDGKRKVIGRFDSAEAAHQAYVERKRELHSAETL